MLDGEDVDGGQPEMEFGDTVLSYWDAWNAAERGRVGCGVKCAFDWIYQIRINIKNNC